MSGPSRIYHLNVTKIRLTKFSFISLLSICDSAINRLKYLITINRMISIVNLGLIANYWHLFKLSVLNVPLRDIFQGFQYSYHHESGKICLLYANVCLLLLQQSKSKKNTVIHI